MDEEHAIDKNWGKGTAGAQDWRHTQTELPFLAAAAAACRSVFCLMS